MKIVFSLPLIVTTLISINGCGTITASLVDLSKRYEDTAEPQKAKLRVIYDMFDNIHISPNGLCSNEADPQQGRLISKPLGKSGINIVSGNSVTFEEKTLGMPLPPFPMTKNSSRVFSEFYIPANRKVLIKYGSQPQGNGGSYCPEKTYAFTPELGKNYETEIIVVRNRCLYRMQEITNEGRAFIQDIFYPTDPASCTTVNAQPGK